MRCMIFLTSRPPFCLVVFYFQFCIVLGGCGISQDCQNWLLKNRQLFELHPPLDYVESPMIPKRIFYVWGAGEKKPRDVQVCIQTWRQVMPDYEIIEINEDSTQYFDFQENLRHSKFFRTVYENKMWAYVADYVRIKTLYDHGGIYFDTDVSAVRPLDKFLKNRAFVGMQNTEYVEPAILGAQKGNALLKKILDFYETDFWRMPIFTMPQIFQHFLMRDYGLSQFPEKPNQKIIHTDDITVYPERYFIPFRYQTEFTPECVESDTCTIHWFGGSWTRPSVIDWLMNKHLVPDLKLDPSRDVVKTIRLSIGRVTIVKIISYANNWTVVRFLKIIPLMKMTDKYLKLFNILPILKIKK